VSPLIATVVYALGIGGLFLLNRDREDRTSTALWIPVVWLLINSSRAVSMWLAAAGITSLPPPTELEQQYLDGSPIDSAVYAALLVMGLIVLISRGRGAGALLRQNGLILLFFAYCALSIYWSDYPFVAFKRWIKAGGDLIMILIVLTDADPKAALKRLFSRGTFLLLPISVLLIKYYPDLGRHYNVWTWTPTVGGVTLGKNLLGMTTLVFGLTSVWRFFAAYKDVEDVGRWRKMIAHGAIMGTSVWLLWVAHSATSSSCFAMAGGLIAITSVPRLGEKRAVVHLLIGAMCCVAIFALFLAPEAGLVEGLGRDATLTGRTAIWQAVLRVSDSRWLGAGFESFWLGDRLEDVARITGIKINEAHNGYLETYLNLGWVGVSLLAVLIVTGYRRVLAAFRREPETGRLMLAFFLVSVIYPFTEAGFRMMTPTWIAFLVAIMAAPINARQAAATESLETTHAEMAVPNGRVSMGAGVRA